jgi:hypothetical protein
VSPLFIRDLIVQKFFTNLALMCLSILLAVGALEMLSRITMPISPGAKNVNIDGTELANINEGRFRHKARLTYRQTASEFDTIVTIDKFGNRLTNEETVPKIIFLGDSFTFGHGLRDDETFAHIYCGKLKLACANMGRSGSGTLVQLDVLEHYLVTENWRPIEVKLFLLAMTSTLMSGNDLLDNYYYAEVQAIKKKKLPGASSSQALAKVRAPDNTNRWLILRKAAIKHSNLARILYFQFAPMLKRKFSPVPKESTLEAALAATKTAFDRLERLGKKFGFEHKIYLLHPVQDILRGTDQVTYRAIKQLHPTSEILDTAKLLTKNATENYFSFDGHFNNKGARKIAKFLIQQSTH